MTEMQVENPSGAFLLLYSSSRRKERTTDWNDAMVKTKHNFLFLRKVSFFRYEFLLAMFKKYLGSTYKGKKLSRTFYLFRKTLLFYLFDS